MNTDQKLAAICGLVVLFSVGIGIGRLYPYPSDKKNIVMPIFRTYSLYAQRPGEGVQYKTAIQLEFHEGGMVTWRLDK